MGEEAATASASLIGPLLLFAATQAATQKQIINKQNSRKKDIVNIQNPTSCMIFITDANVVVQNNIAKSFN